MRTMRKGNVKINRDGLGFGKVDINGCPLFIN